MNDLSTQTDAKQLVSTLQNSLFVGCKAESIEMAIAYCQAAQLDIMQKPVHIVPMNTKNPVSGNYEWRDVVMPGIGMYRIQADRSQTMAGISEPEFGPEMTQEFTDKDGRPVSVTYPEWCKVIARKIVGDHIVEFVAKEYWIENYATDSRKSTAPNAMWRKRPKGQIVKCAEAQALRKGWPEIGQAPTAEEMEGKTIDVNDAPDYSQQAQDRQPIQAEVLPFYPADEFEKNKSKWVDLIDSGKQSPDSIINKVCSKYTMTDEQITELKKYA